MLRLSVVAVLLAVTCSSAALGGDPIVSDVPRLDGISIDGDPADWGERGFRIELLASPQLELRPTDDLEAECRLGWTAEGLLALVSVLDDTPYESRRDDALWEGDSIDIFVAADRETGAYGAFIVSPGLDAEYPDPRIQPWDQRIDKSEEMVADIEVREQEGGYVVEILFPWSNLKLAPSGGEEVGFQVFVNEADGPGAAFTAVWYPLLRSEGGSRASHIVRLAEEAGPPVRVAARASHERFRRLRVDVAAVGELAGETVALCEDASARASAELAEAEGRASAKLVIPLPPRGEPLPEVAVCLGDTAVAPCELPDLERARGRAFIEQARFHFRPYVFAGDSFPPCDFERPHFAEDLVGPYAIERTFYNRDYNEVDSADEPGRYGAIVKVVPEQGKPLTLYRTLFRLPEGQELPWELPWFPRGGPLSVDLSALPGADKHVLEQQADAINDVFWMLFRSGLNRDSNLAALASGLAEPRTGGGKDTIANDLFARDRQWWVGLKRKLYEMEAAYPDPFECPRPKEGEPAPALHEGTPEEAGMDPEGVEKIDALLKEWAADADEGFAVCLARHGVVFLHKAYGERDGRPMTITDKSRNASITKLLSATLTMMLVDQGRVDLEDTVDKFLPPFRGVEVETPITIRHLYTHTAGLWGHWGDELHDFDQLIAYHYPYLEVGKRFEYNGAGYSIAGKIIEMVSGEAIPLFYKRHLLDPLGCENLDVIGNSGDSSAAPMDLAKIGQLLLNRGAHGDLRFFREETAEKMKQQRLTNVLGPHTGRHWGIGQYNIFEDQFGQGTFGHGAASSADLIVSPEKDLVVVMTRNAAGENFGKYHLKFLEAVADAID